VADEAISNTDCIQILTEYRVSYVAIVCLQNIWIENTGAIVLAGFNTAVGIDVGGPALSQWTGA
jgi:hypothetical protein